MIIMDMSCPIDRTLMVVPGYAEMQWKVFEEILLGFLTGEKLGGLRIHVSEERSLTAITRIWKSDPIDLPISQASELNKRFFKLLRESPKWLAVIQPRKLLRA